MHGLKDEEVEKRKELWTLFQSKEIQLEKDLQQKLAKKDWSTEEKAEFAAQYKSREMLELCCGEEGQFIVIGANLCDGTANTYIMRVILVVVVVWFEPRSFVVEPP